MNIATIKTQWAETLAKKADKLTVRECDKVEPGQFVAYVDLGAQSFDVMVRFSPSGNLLEHQCDCGTDNRFCEHRYALALFLEKGKQTEAKQPKVKRKKSKEELLLQEVEDAPLRKWLKEQLEADKELFFRFENAFTKQEKTYTIADVQHITAEAIKSVAGRKSKLDLSQYTKIVQLFKTVHKPIVDQYLAQVSNMNGFLNLCQLIESCYNFHENSKVNSTKLKTYLESIMEEVALALNQLESEQAWQTACMPYFEYLLSKEKANKRWTIHFLIKYFETLVMARKQWFTAQLQPHVNQALNSRQQNYIEVQSVLWTWVEATNEFARYFETFVPESLNDSFNLNLFNKLLAIGQQQRVEHFLAPFLNSEYTLNRTTKYHELMRKIYEERGQQKMSKKIIEQTILINLSFEDFLWLEAHMDAESYKKLRAKLISRAKPYSYAEGREDHKYEFMFALLKHEGKFKKMIEYLAWGTPLHLIEENFEAMAKAAPVELLNGLSFASYDSDYYWRTESAIAAENKINLFMAKVKLFITKETAKQCLSKLSSDRWYVENQFNKALQNWIKE